MSYLVYETRSLALLYHDYLHKYKQALLDYDAVTAIDPRNEMAYLHRARLYANELGMKIEAVKEGDKVLQFNSFSKLAMEDRKEYLKMGN